MGLQDFAVTVLTSGVVSGLVSALVAGRFQLRAERLARRDEHWIAVRTALKDLEVVYLRVRAGRAKDVATKDAVNVEDAGRPEVLGSDQTPVDGTTADQTLADQMQEVEAQFTEKVDTCAHEPLTQVAGELREIGRLFAAHDPDHGVEPFEEAIEAVRSVVRTRLSDVN